MKLSKIAFLITLICLSAECYSEVSQILSTFQSKKKQTDLHFQEAIEEAPYDETLFTQAYQIYLASQNVQAAYAIAKKSVQVAPKVMIWRYRLAQTALWTGRIDESLKEWLYIINQTHKEEDIKQALKIAQSVYYLDVEVKLYEIQLKKNPNQVNIRLDLAKAQNASGDPEKAIETLKPLLSPKPNKEALKELAQIYSDQGKPEKQREILNQLKDQYGYSSQEATKLAELEFNQGEIRSAYQTLKNQDSLNDLHTASDWKLFLEAAYLNNDYTAVNQAFNHLQKLGGADLEAFNRVIAVSWNDKPHQAYQYAFEGWKRFKSDIFLFIASDLGTKQRQYDAIITLFNQLTSKEKMQLESQVPYWQSLINLALRLGNIPLAESLLQQKIQEFPHNIELRIAYIELANYEKDKSKLEQLLIRFQRDFLSNPEFFWFSYAESFDEIEKPLWSMELYHSFLPKENIQPVQLLYYANSLDQLYYKNLAYLAKKEAVFKALDTLKSNDSDSAESLKILGKAARYFANADVTFFILTSLVDQNIDISNGAEMLSWALDQRYFPLIRYLQFYFFNNQIPNRDRLQIALLQNDLETLKKLLKKPATLQPLDRINAAIRLHAIAEAQTMAYEDLQRKPSSAERYDQLTDVMLKTSANMSFDSLYEQFQLAAGPKSILKGSYFVTPTFSITPFAQHWFPKSIDEENFINSPNLDRTYGVEFEKTYRERALKIILADRKALEHFFTALFSYEENYSSRFSYTVQVGYNQRALDSTFLLLGGVQDEIGTNFQYKITERDYLLTSMNARRYYTQQRNYLSSSAMIAEDWEHKFWLSYPDLTLGFFGEMHGYHRNGTLTGSILQFYPELQNGPVTDNQLKEALRNTSPKSYLLGGIHFHFGDNLLNDYSHAWRPYASISLFYGTLVGMGNGLELGYTGSVFGRDKLSFYGNQARNVVVNQQNNYSIGFRYQLYL